MSRARGVLALAVCVVAVGLIGLAVPGTQEHPRHRDAALGAWADNAHYSARVVDVTLARTVEHPPDSYRKPVEAPPGAVAVVIRLEHRTHREVVRVASLSSLVGGDGRRSRAASSSAIPETGPGFIGAGELIFIVAEDSVAGARLVLPSQSRLFTGLVVDTIRVDLALDATTPVADRVEVRPEDRRVAP